MTEPQTEAGRALATEAHVTVPVPCDEDDPWAVAHGNRRYDEGYRDGRRQAVAAWLASPVAEGGLAAALDYYYAHIDGREAAPRLLAVLRKALEAEPMIDAISDGYSRFEEGLGSRKEHEK